MGVWTFGIEGLSSSLPQSDAHGVSLSMVGEKYPDGKDSFTSVARWPCGSIVYGMRMQKVGITGGGLPGPVESGCTDRGGWLGKMVLPVCPGSMPGVVQLSSTE